MHLWYDEALLRLGSHSAAQWREAGTAEELGLSFEAEEIGDVSGMLSAAGVDQSGSTSLIELTFLCSPNPVAALIESSSSRNRFRPEFTASRYCCVANIFAEVCVVSVNKLYRTT